MPHQSLAELHDRFPTDKGSAHNYLDFYEQLFEPARDDAGMLLEIGVLLGGSLRLWEAYFSRLEIVGIDDFSQTETTESFGGIDVDRDTVKKSLAPFERIRFIEPVNARDSVAVANAFSDFEAPFDFIIDDGDHSMESQLEVFDNFLPKLGQNGAYVIEDVVSIFTAETIIEHIQERYGAAYPDMQMTIHTFKLHLRFDDIIVLVRPGLRLD